MKRLILSIIIISLLTPALLFASGAAESSGEVLLKWPNIWVAEDSKAATIAALVDQFNKDNAGSIRVEIEPNPDYDGYRDKINTSIAAGAVPDLFIFNPEPTTFQYYAGDVLFDFTDALKGSWGDDFVDGTIAGATVDGRTKSVPYEIAITPIWYNTALFEKAGIEEFPKTFEAFEDACEKLLAIGIAPTSQMTGGTNAWTSMLWYSHIMGSLGGADVWSNRLDDGNDLYEKAASYLKVMYDKYTTADAVGADAGVSGGHYMAGRTAMFINGPWYIGRIRSEAPEIYAATKVAPAPAVPGGKHGGQIGFALSNLAAGNTNNAAKKEAVLSFIQWLTKPENVKLVSLDAGSLFAIKYSIDASDEIDPLQAAFVSASANASFIATHFQAQYSSQVVVEFGQALGAMALGRATPKQFVQQLIDAQ